MTPAAAHRRPLWIMQMGWHLVAVTWPGAQENIAEDVEKIRFFCFLGPRAENDPHGVGGWDKDGKRELNCQKTRSILEVFLDTIVIF